MKSLKVHADPMLYKLIKREMDCGHGIVSQVLIVGKASGLGQQGSRIGRNQLQQYIMNVSLKVNHKLGGQNLRIRGFGELHPDAPAIWSKKPTMLLGIDVTHPQSFDMNEPSIVGIVASMDGCVPVTTLSCFQHRSTLLGVSAHYIVTAFKVSMSCWL